MDTNTETSIRNIIRNHIESYANIFAERHIADVDNPNGVINSKINNVFISSLNENVIYYTALLRSFDSSLGNLLEKIARDIAKLSYDVYGSVTGKLYPGQTAKIAELLEAYKNNKNSLKPSKEHYEEIKKLNTGDEIIEKTHVSDYYLYDKQTKTHHLIELKIGGDLDNKKARSEKEAIFEQYAILTNTIGKDAKVECHFATAYNKFGENKEWNQGRVLQFFSKDELLIGKDFWNFICYSDDGYNVVIDEYKKSSRLIDEAFNNIRKEYLG